MVKCEDCGFLALRTARSELVEATEWFRQTGTPENLQQLDLHMRPLCFARAFNLAAEITALDNQRVETESHRQNLAVIQKERPCERFTAWQQGFTPKEHREMLDEQWKREFEATRLQEDHEWRGSQEDRMREWQQRRDERRLRWEIIVFGVIVTLILAGSTIVAALIQRGILF